MEKKEEEKDKLGLTDLTQKSRKLIGAKTSRWNKELDFLHLPDTIQ